ncbi:hypothetical protein U1Q18_001705, partial [Sarracenia purpurea var. burkii]
MSPTVNHNAAQHPTSAQHCASAQHHASAQHPASAQSSPAPNQFSQHNLSATIPIQGIIIAWPLPNAHPMLIRSKTIE